MAMEYIGKFLSNFKEYYNGINAATLTGAIDVIIVQQEDGTFLSSPFHVRFGKLGVLRSREKVVDIEINGDPVEIHMKLGESGEAFFVYETEKGEGEIPAYLATSPIPISIAEEQSTNSGGYPKDLQNGTLMGNRDDGILNVKEDTSQEDIILGSLNPSAFVAEAVLSASVEIDVNLKEKDDDLSPSNLDLSPEMGEEERKKLARRRRKRRSQMRKKQLKEEASKVSSESEMGLDEEDVDDSLAESTPPDFEPVKPVFSSSLAAIEMNPDSSSSPDRISDWIQESNITTSSMISRSLGPDFHFFSDTEIEVGSTGGSRPPTPVHSDTEYEVEQQRRNSSTNDTSKSTTQQSWRWGELPSPPIRTPPSKPTSRNPSRDASPCTGVNKECSDVGKGAATESSSGRQDINRQNQSSPEELAQRSMLSHMFSFMRQAKKMHKQGNVSGGGIYLDDLNLDDLDPELAALYFPSSSFRHGSATANVAIRAREEDSESGKGPSLPQSPRSTSIAAIHGSSGPRSVDSDFEDMRSDFRTFPEVTLSLCGSHGAAQDPPEDLFLQSIVTYDDFVENPRLVENPDLVVKIGNKYYTWQTACPMIMSWALYQRPLPQTSVEGMLQENKGSQQPVLHQQNVKPVEEKKPPAPEVAPPPRSSYSWFPWRKKNNMEQPVLASTAPVDSKIVQVTNVTKLTGSLDNSVLANRTSGTSSDNESDTTQPDGAKLPLERRSYYDKTDVYCKTLRLTTEQIAMLHLREGPNEAAFSVTTAYQGTTRCKCHIYLWKYDDKVVISDIDGTITKSDVLGHILPIVGQDWAQGGVAQLFTKIKNNGYRILYLSARAIGQARITREYLRSVRQGDLSLPDGPLLLNPTSLLSALHREVIEKKPEEFKISCLRDIQALFPTQSNPFYAGYGNKVNDVWAYRAIGIPTSRIFTINPRGELKLELTQTFQSSYSKQSFIVDLVFPPLNGAAAEALEGAEYNEFVFWKEPVLQLPDNAASEFLEAYKDSNASRNRRSSREKK